MIAEIWKNLSRPARWSLAAGVLVILAGTAVLAWTLLHIERQVLFSRLSQRDAAAMTAELDKMKVPYALSDEGGTIWVDGDKVHKLRLQLMSTSVPLHGAVGFELFNNADFGMTEFAQRVNYQRALQGELTRTIQSLGEIETVRVHLALPEESLFKRNAQKPKAAITVSLRQGQQLRPDQVSGIQRLVASSVPSIQASDVTIVNEEGVALSRQAPQPGEVAEAGGRLELKRETEQLLSRKAAQVMDKLLGPGQALVTVDVELGQDQLRVTSEELIPAQRSGDAVAGVLLRERQVSKEGSSGTVRDGASTSQRDAEYAVGRRTEQLVSPAGRVKQIHVAAVVTTPLDAQQLTHAQALLTAAVGASPERGDVVVIQVAPTLKPATGLGGIGSVGAPEATAPPSAHEAQASALPQAPVMSADTSRHGLPVWAWLAMAFLATLAVLLGALSWRNAASVQRLSPQEREQLIKQLRLWLEAGEQPLTHSSSSPSAGQANDIVR